MADWTKGMQQTFEYYEVDPATWRDKRLLSNIISSTVNRDGSNETLGSATIDSSEEYGEMYVRIYLVVIQTEGIEKFSLGTFLIQTPHDTFNGKSKTYSYDAYTPLLELKDNIPPLGYFVPKGTNIMDIVNRLCFNHCRVPYVPGSAEYELAFDFVASDSDTWLSFLSDLMANAKHSFGLDDLCRIIFYTKIDTASMRPVWNFTDDNSSILYSDFSRERDLYGIPNVVEVVYSAPSGRPMYAEVINDDPNSPTSTVSRGRTIIHRETSPSLNGQPTQEELEEYATVLLRELSTLEYSVTYTHGYCPVNLGDCVLLNYSRAGIENVKAKVVSQSISCIPGCPVEETAIFTEKMWEK